MIDNCPKSQSLNVQKFKNHTKPNQLILADELTGSLDPENRDLVLKFLLEMNREGKTVIIVTHDAYVAQQCHRIIELGEGK